MNNVLIPQDITIDFDTDKDISFDFDTEQDIDFSFGDAQIGGDYPPLTNKPKINGVTLVGDVSIETLGIVNDKNYVHNQTTSSDTWVIEHNLNKYPTVSIINSADEEVIGEVIYDSVNQLTIKFAAAFKGKATLN